MTPRQILVQLEVIEMQLEIMRKAAEQAAMPQSVVMGFHWLHEDAGKTLVDIRAALPNTEG